MAGHGGKRPGAGRKSNIQKARERDALLSGLGDLFTLRAQIENWKRLLSSSDERTVLGAMIYLTNRAHGKPITQNSEVINERFEPSVVLVNQNPPACNPLKGRRLEDFGGDENQVTQWESRTG